MSMFHEAKTTILGNTAGPAEVRWAAGAEPKKVAKLRICTEYGGGPNREPHKEWHTVILFGRYADQAEKFVTRSMMVYVEGRPKTRRWKNDADQDVSVLEVIANVFRPVGYQKGDANNTGQSPQRQGSTQTGGNRPSQPQSAAPQRAPHTGGYPQGYPEGTPAGNLPQGPGQASAPPPGNFGGGPQQPAGQFDDELDDIPF